MSVENHDFYPGDQASAEEFAALADEYRRAAAALLPLGIRRKPMSRAPYRLTAIHAIELYLSAYLIRSGEPWVTVRGMQHNLARRTELAKAKGLVLRKGTALHLAKLVETREYLRSRYDPGQSAASRLNRLQASLDDVARKVRAAITK